MPARLVRMDRAARLSSLSPLEQTVLAALELTAETTLSEDEAAGLAGVDDVAEAIAELVRRGFVEREGEGVRLRAAWRRAAEASDRAYTILDRAVDLAETGRLSPETLLALTGWAIRAGRYREALAVVRAAESALAAARRVEAWIALVERARAAARALGDRDAEAWAEQRLRAREPLPAERRRPPSDAAAPSWSARVIRRLLLTLGLATAATAGLAVGLVAFDDPADVGAAVEPRTEVLTRTETVRRTVRELVTVPTTVSVTETVPGPATTETVTTTLTVTVPTTVTVTVTEPPPNPVPRAGPAAVGVPPPPP